MSLSERSLELSYIAISCGRIGKDFNDPRLLQQGWRAYCGGMRELQRALTDPQRTWTVETLAASQLLGMYELFEGVTPGFTAWMTHVRGATKLIEARGPGSYSNDLAYRLFLGHRLQEVRQFVRFLRDKLTLNIRSSLPCARAHRVPSLPSCGVRCLFSIVLKI